MGRGTLFAGPCFAEFGIELYWAMGVRFAAQFYDRTVVCSRTGREAIYADFADEFVPHDLDCICVGGKPLPGHEPRQEEIAALIPHDATVFPPLSPVDWGNTFPEPMADRLLPHKYGRERDEFADVVLLHARARTEWGAERNWPAAKWDALMGALRPGLDGLRVLSIGTYEGALHVSGTEDARGASLATLMDMMASAKLTVGPSSGPMHLASLCGCPHVVWIGGDGKDDGKKMTTLRKRYVEAWRPFATPVILIKDVGWDPDPGVVCAQVLKFLDREPVLTAKKVGIFILAYYGLADLVRAVRSVQRFTTVPYELVVWDNSEHWNGRDEPRVDGCVTIKEWCETKAPEVHYHASPKNVGCAVPRNWANQYFAGQGYKYWVHLDQDIEVIAARWVADKRDVMEAYPDTALVGWPLANLTNHRVDPSGEVSELPGMCCMHRSTAIQQVPYCEEYKHFRFDSDECLNLRTHGWKTRIVLGRGDKIRHVKPHSGIERDPDWRAVRARSEALFRRRTWELGFEEVAP